MFRNPVREPVIFAVLLAAAAVLFKPAFAQDKPELKPETIKKLQQLVTIEDDEAGLGDVLQSISEQTGLSVVVPVMVLEMPEEVMVIARKVPAAELLKAIVAAMHVECTVTPSGIIVLSMSDKDPRRHAMLREMFHPPGDEEAFEEMQWHRRIEEEIERASDHPKIRNLLEKWDARLFPGPEFEVDRDELLFRIARDDDAPTLGIVRMARDGRRIEIRMGPPAEEDADREKGREHKGKKQKEKF